MRKPAEIYKQQLRINPKYQKKLLSIEDLVTILPTSAESDNNPPHILPQEDYVGDSLSKKSSKD